MSKAKSRDDGHLSEVNGRRATIHVHIHHATTNGVFFRVCLYYPFSRTLSRHFELRKQIGVGGRDKFLPRGWVIGEVNYHTLARNSAFRNMTTKLQAVKARIHRLTSLSLDFNRLTISSRPPTKERTISPAS